MDRTALSYWFPKIQAAGLPVPRSRIVTMSGEAVKGVWDRLEAAATRDEAAAIEHDVALDIFCAELKAAAAEVGSPFFLRTDHTSGKHDRDRCCFVTSPGLVKQHVVNIAMSSEMADLFGLPWDTWAVREMLPTMPLGACPGYGNMPVCREFRFFAGDGEVRCHHPYWPADALAAGGADIDYEERCALDTGTAAHLRGLARTASRVCGGAWSVDILEATDAWYVTDMAEAHRSWHWPDCAHAGKPAP